MKKILFIPLLIIACQAPKEENSSEAKDETSAVAENKEISLADLKKEVIDIHDEVMPKMGELRRARKALMLWADSIRLVDSAKAEILIAASDNLDSANESMMDWMRKYEPEFEGTDEEVLQYFNDQKAAITKVKKKMLGSLEEGQKLLGNNQ